MIGLNSTGLAIQDDTQRNIKYNKVTGGSLRYKHLQSCSIRFGGPISIGWRVSRWLAKSAHADVTIIAIILFFGNRILNILNTNDKLMIINI